MRCRIIIYRSVACEHRAYNVKPRIAHEHRAAAHAEIVKEAAAAYCVTHAVGIKSAATTCLVLLRRIAHFVIRLAVHHGEAVEHNAVSGIGIIGKQHVVNIARRCRGVDFSRKDCLLFQLPRFFDTIAVEVGEGTLTQEIVYILIIIYP